MRRNENGIKEHDRKVMAQRTGDEPADYAASMEDEIAQKEAAASQKPGADLAAPPAH